MTSYITNLSIPNSNLLAVSVSAQAFLLTTDSLMGPLANGVVALGNVPAGLQIHVDIPEVRIMFMYAYAVEHVSHMYVDHACICCSGQIPAGLQWHVDISEACIMFMYA
jgi:hypothetical protein